WCTWSTSSPRRHRRRDPPIRRTTLLRRPLLALPLALASALVLAGCAGDDGSTEPDDTGTPQAQIDVCSAPSGAATDAVEVTGDFASVPDVTISAPLEVADT